MLKLEKPYILKWLHEPNRKSNTILLQFKINGPLKKVGICTYLNGEKIEMEKYDVIIVGGGFSGTAAAISAARDGCSVLLVEQSNCLGGAAQINLVTPFMGYRTQGDNPIVLSCGLFEEITGRVEKVSGLPGKSKFHEEYLKLVLQRMALEAGVSLLFNTTFVRSNKEGGTIRSLEFVNKSGVFSKEAAYYIDATGDADVAFSADCPFHVGREDGLCQPMTLCFRAANADVQAYFADKENLNKTYKKLQTEGKIRNLREDVLTFETPVNGVLHFNSTRVVKLNPTNGEDITRAEIEAREQVFELFAFLKKHACGFEHAQLLSTAIRIGTRESRMIDGIYTLSKEDIMACRKFPDGIAACCYDMDIHSPDGTGTYHWFLPKGEYYTVPYRCLLPQRADNLLVVGRCISSTHEAQASCRIMPVVCCIGEAAGTAVSIAKKENILPAAVNCDELRSQLIKKGAFVG